MQNRTSLPALGLDDGLLLRQATRQDAAALAAFNIRIHSDDRNDPELWLGEWTRDLLNGKHPTTTHNDVTVVVDPRAEHKIVSSTVLIPQTWRYEEIAIGVGRPELIGTDESYRRRGLVRKQMEILHGWSKGRGHLAQVITGIPYYYRRFGYEMALDLGGSRMFPLDRLRKLKIADDEEFRVRGTTVADHPILESLYARHCAASMVSRLRDEKQWRYEVHDVHKSSEYRRRVRLVEAVADGTTIGYFEFARWKGRLAVREIAAAPGFSLRRVALQAAHYLRNLGAATENGEQQTLLFVLGVEHPAYRALARELVFSSEPYAWYVRVPDLAAFLTTISPVLERRVAASVVAGYSGALRLNCTTDYLQLNWEKGTLVSVESFEPKHFYDGDAFFPGMTFLQLLFGYRDLIQLHQAHPDCFGGNEETYVVLSALFPRKNSQPIGLG